MFYLYYVLLYFIILKFIIIILLYRIKGICCCNLIRLLNYICFAKLPWKLTKKGKKSINITYHNSEQ